MALQGRERPFVSEVSLGQVLVLYEVLTLFIDTVVREVCINIRFDRVYIVRFACKPHEAFIVDIHFERVKVGHQNVKPQVEFQAVNEQGVVNVTTNNLGFGHHLKLRKVIYHVDALALRA